MNENATLECLGYPIFSDTLQQLPKQQRLTINTVNQYSFCMAEKDPEFKKALTQSDVLLPDGIGIVKAAKIVNGKTIKKIAGADLHEFLLKSLNVDGGSCFYMGSSEATLLKIKERLSKEYPNIRVGVYSPPFKSEFTEEENTEILKAVNQFKPDVLFVGMTAPKQEKWSHYFKNEVEAQIICSIGAVFDFYAGTVKRPGQVWIDMGLEWLGRLIKEPRRMWKRYIYYGFVFCYYLIKEKARRLFHRNVSLG